MVSKNCISVNVLLTLYKTSLSIITLSLAFNLIYAAVYFVRHSQQYYEKIATLPTNDSVEFT